HTAVLVTRDGTARLLLDGKIVAERAGFTRPDVAGHVFKIGSAAPDFAGELNEGTLSKVQVWSRALPDTDIALLFDRKGVGANTPDFEHAPSVDGSDGRPVIEPASGVKVTKAWVQALERSDHSEIVAG